MHTLRLLAISLVIALCAFAAPSAAGSTAATGAAKLPIGAKGAGLREPGLRLAPVFPAKVHGRHLALPVAKLRLPTVKRAALRLRGGLKLIAGRRSAVITALSLELGRPVEIDASAEALADSFAAVFGLERLVA